MSNLFPKVKNMGDQWEARIGAIENIQEEFEHDIREIKEWLSQTDKFARRPYQDRGSASSRPITLAKSTGPSTIRPDYELFAT